MPTSANLLMLGFDTLDACKLLSHIHGGRLLESAFYTRHLAIRFFTHSKLTIIPFGKMKIKFSRSFLVLIALIICCLAVSGEPIRAKRQVQQNARPNVQRPALPADLGANSPSVSSSSATSVASSVSSNAPLPNSDSNLNVAPGRPKGQTRPLRPNARPPTNAPNDESFGFDQDDEAPQVAPPPARRRRPLARPTVRPDRYNNDHEDDEDCDNNDHDADYHDYGNVFRAAFRPMRQMGDMMGNMFEHMQSLASGDYENLSGGGNYAVASARSDGSGYSRQSSIVNNNGKRRGIITETRNGRTQTRRIGDDDDDE